MAQNFLPCDRDQQFLLPPSPRDWLPEDHLAWFVIEAVETFDLQPFYADYRADGHGRAAHDPQMMVALLLYAYATGTRSSRAIERHLIDDVAFRVIAAGQCPDHATIARFRRRHEQALCGLFSEVLALCAKAGIVRPGTLALDSTKLHAHASDGANLSYEQIARAILDDAAATDAAEDELYGERRGDELPEGLRTWRERRDWLRKAKRELEAEQAAREHPGNSREARLVEARRRLAEQHALERHALEAEQAAPAKWLAEQRERGRKPTGRRRIHPLLVPERPAGRINVSDPDSRPVKTTRGFIQGYSAQAAATEDQIIVMAEVTVGGPDQGKLQALAERTLAELERVGADPPAVLLADAGYWHGPQIAALRHRGIDALVAPSRQIRRAPLPRTQAPLAAELRKRLDTDEGRTLYRKRQRMIEPIFGQTKANRGFERFLCRGLGACQAEWSLITATHNLLKVWRHGLALARVDDGGGVSQRRLMDELGLTSGTVSVRMDRLVAQGLVDRRADPGSARNTLISLTARGRELFERVVPAHLNNERRLLSGLSDEELELLGALLRKLLVEFEGSRPPAEATIELGLTLAPAHVAVALREAVGLPAVAGLLVRDVADGGPADAAGFRTGDVLIAAGRRELRSVADLYAAIDEAAADGRLRLKFVRGTQPHRATMRLGAAADSDRTSAATAGRSASREHRL